MKHLLLILATTVGAAAYAQNYRVVETWTNDGYREAVCPAGYRAERCDFDRNNCDNTQQGRDYCGADSRDHRTCVIRANCYSQPQRVRISGSTSNGYRETYCPAGFRVQTCSFDSQRCDNTRQNRYFCGADSRNRQSCNYSGICVSER